MTYKKFKHIAISSYYRVIHPFRRLYWFIFRPESRGAKAVIFWEGKVLLVRLSYGHKSWTFPGGGVERNESFYDAALREAEEEVGIRVDTAEFFYEYHSAWQYKRNKVQCFAVHVSSGDFTIDEQEIAGAGWFPPDMLPEHVRPIVPEVLLKYNERANHV